MTRQPLPRIAVQILQLPVANGSQRRDHQGIKLRGNPAQHDSAFFWIMLDRRFRQRGTRRLTWRKGNGTLPGIGQARENVPGVGSVLGKTAERIIFCCRRQEVQTLYIDGLPVADGSLRDRPHICLLHRLLFLWNTGGNEGRARNA